MNYGDLVPLPKLVKLFFVLCDLNNFVVKVTYVPVPSPCHINIVLG